MLTDSQKKMIENIIGYRWRVEFFDTVPSSARILGTISDEDWEKCKASLEESAFRVASFFSDGTDYLIFEVEDTVPTKPAKNTPFAVGQRWYCDRTKSRVAERGRLAFTFVILGPGKFNPKDKRCRLEEDAPRLGFGCSHGMTGDYTNKHLKKYAVLVKG